MRAEQRAMLACLPELTGARALDLACGSGRYASLLAQAGATDIVALDSSVAMLRQVAGASRVQACMMQLPFPNASFDLVVSGLAVGHASDLRPWLREVALVLKPGGDLLYSDFHAAASRAGLERTFRDRDGRRHSVPHRCFAPSEHRADATAVGLTVDTLCEIRLGIELHEPFPGSQQFYRQWHGLPVVLVVRARKS
jgi:malonyl-CoA O-methyltransferase